MNHLLNWLSLTLVKLSEVEKSFIITVACDLIPSLSSLEPTHADSLFPSAPQPF